MVIIHMLILLGNPINRIPISQTTSNTILNKLYELSRDRFRFDLLQRLQA